MIGDIQGLSAIRKIDKIPQVVEVSEENKSECGIVEIFTQDGKVDVKRVKNGARVLVQ